MGYAHIDNLYKSQDILMFRECFAMEKIHGTSAHVSFDVFTIPKLKFFSGGESHVNFVKLFDVEVLTAKFEALNAEKVIVYGEAYGGKQQKQSHRYGNALKFVAFDVKIGDYWLSVPDAEQVVLSLGLEFVHYRKVPAEIEALNNERDAPSEQAKRNGVKGIQTREGVVLRPLREMHGNDGSRIVSKHKRAEERETATNRDVVDPSTLAVLEKAEDIANEWVTPTRLEHVLDKLGPVGLDRTKDVIVAMVEDVVREGKGEIIDSKDARRAIGKKTAELFRKRFTDALQEM